MRTSILLFNNNTSFILGLLCPVTEIIVQIIKNIQQIVLLFLDFKICFSDKKVDK